MTPSNHALRLAKLLKQRGLASNPWPSDYTFDEFVMTFPVEERSWLWRAVEELESLSLVERRLMGSSWFQRHGIHPREYNDYYYLFWTEEGLQTIANLD